MRYAEKLRDPRWQKKRLEIFGRDEFTCQSCGSKAVELHCHHTFYEPKTEPWDADKSHLVTLCSICHDEVEDAIKTVRLSLWNKRRARMFEFMAFALKNGLGDAKVEQVCADLYFESIKAHLK